MALAYTFRYNKGQSPVVLFMYKRLITGLFGERVLAGLNLP